MKSDVNQPVPFSDARAASGSNRNGVIFLSAERNQTDDPDGLGAGLYASEEMHNPGARGVDIFVDTTSSGSGTVAVKVQKKDPNSGTWHDIVGAVTATLNDPADSVLTIYPGIAETANVSVSDHLGLTWRVVATVATAAATFSVGAVYLK